MVSPRRLTRPAFAHVFRWRPVRCRGQPHLRPSSAADSLVRPPGWARGQSSAAASSSGRIGAIALAGCNVRMLVSTSASGSSPRSGWSGPSWCCKHCGGPLQQYAGESLILKAAACNTRPKIRPKLRADRWKIFSHFVLVAIMSAAVQPMLFDPPPPETADSRLMESSLDPPPAPSSRRAWGRHQPPR